MLGSELAAALEEVRLIRELRPPANTRKPQPERYVYLRRRGGEVVVTQAPTALGPLRSRRTPSAPRGRSPRRSQEEFDGCSKAGRWCGSYERLADLADCLRYEDAARLRDRLEALERVIDQLRRLERLRASKLRARARGRARLAEGVLRSRRPDLRRSLIASRSEAGGRRRLPSGCPKELGRADDARGGRGSAAARRVHQASAARARSAPTRG